MAKLEWKFIYRQVLFLSPNLLFFGYFSKKFSADLLTYVQNIFFHNFYTFEVKTHFLAEESFLNKYLITLLNITPGIGILEPSFLQSAFTIIFKVDINFQPST